MHAATNPLIPPVYDVIWAGLPLLVLAVAVVAIVSILRFPRLSIAEKLAWVAAALFLPLVGPLAWLIVRTLMRQHRPSA